MKNRLVYLDFAKGVGIILMVIGHIHIDDTLNKFIYAFHMPLFFIVSGMLYSKKKSFSQLVRNRFRSLVLPYIVFGGGYTVLNILREVLIKNNRTVSLYSLFSFWFFPTENIPFESALWFLPVMFIVSVAYYFINKYVTIDYVVSIIIMVLGIIGFVCPYILSIRLPLGLDTALVSILFYHVGHLFQKKDIINRATNAIYKIKSGYRVLILFGFLLFITICISINQDFNMRMAQWGIIPLSFINAVISSMLLIIISKAIEDSQFIKDSVVVKWVCYISEISILFICINHPTILVFTKLFTKLFSILSMNVSWLIYVFVLVSSLTFMSVAGRIITKTRFSIILGKNRCFDR